MILFKKAIDLSKWLDAQRKDGSSCGFVPTMGALHAGHLSLIEASRKENNITVCSIFVNPTQFNDPRDFEKYPITIEKDIEMLHAAACDVLFLPSVNEIYPDWPNIKPEHYDLGELEQVLEGAFRPGHFQGVCMVVYRLLMMVKPDKLYLGSKDYQQCMVIRRLIETSNMKNIQTVISPTLREPDGLAMSSRNVRLNKQDRETAVHISRVLKMIRDEIKPGETAALKERAKKLLEEKGFRVDYVAITEADNLQAVTNWNGQTKLVALIAAFLNDVRLIDNLTIS